MYWSLKTNRSSDLEAFRVKVAQATLKLKRNRAALLTLQRRGGWKNLWRCCWQLALSRLIYSARLCCSLS